MKNPQIHKKIAVICYMDGYANSEKPKFIKRALEARGHSVDLINTMLISRLGDQSVLKFLPALNPLKMVIYSTEVLIHIVRTHLPIAKAGLYPLTVLQMKARAKIINEVLDRRRYDVVICENQIDSMVMLKNKTSSTLIYDCPTPFADEMYFGKELTENQYRNFKELEIKVYEAADYLSFHWSSYAEYAKKYYKDTGNMFEFNYSKPPSEIKASYAKKPRIAYFGYLGGYWINLPLLAELAKRFEIDVFGAPRPSKKYGLNYKGYAKPAKLNEYQFGLITITKDRLRSEGFSAKHMEYLSHGLPVLMPKWRTNAGGMGGTVFYDQDNFLDVVRRYSKKNAWLNLHNGALREAAKHDGAKAIKSLIKIIEKPAARQNS